jgi:hypothetical protein
MLARTLLALSLMLQLAHAAPGRVHSPTRVLTAADGSVLATATPTGWGADDLQAAYHLPASGTSVGTIAIVDAYGAPALESDLARYRAYYHLPPCTRANGCLTIVNQNGTTSPLPKPPAAGTFDWALEQTIDVDMASVGCPSCKLIVIETDDESFVPMFNAQQLAVALGASVISDSWGALEANVEAAVGVATADQVFVHAGVATFVSGGDSGYDCTSGCAATGPQYPATSANVIAVGGTVLSSNGTGYSETVWPSSGSSCSQLVEAPSWQPTSAPCQFRAADDVSAVATGIALYYAAAGGWVQIYGTSASSPLVAAIFTATGLAGVTGEDVAHLASTFQDVTIGSNGPCSNSLCVAGPGWDAPTGYGTPDARKLLDGARAPQLSITSPQPGATVSAGFVVNIDASNAARIELAIDGAPAGSVTSPPYAITTPSSLAAGAHHLEVTAYGALGKTATADIDVTLASGPSTPPPADGTPQQMIGGCSAGGTSGIGVTLALLALARRRRR